MLRFQDREIQRPRFCLTQKGCFLAEGVLVITALGLCLAKDTVPKINAYFPDSKSTALAIKNGAYDNQRVELITHTGLPGFKELTPAFEVQASVSRTFVLYTRGYDHDTSMGIRAAKESVELQRQTLPNLKLDMLNDPTKMYFKDPETDPFPRFSPGFPTITRTSFRVVGIVRKHLQGDGRFISVEQYLPY